MNGPRCCPGFANHPAAAAKAIGTPIRKPRNSQVEIRNTICQRKNRRPVRCHLCHPSPIMHCFFRTDSNRMKRNTLLIYKKTKNRTNAKMRTVAINAAYCAMRAGSMCGINGGAKKRSPPLRGRDIGTLKFGKPPHPPECSSAARIPTSARRDHCPQRKRVNSCSLVCWIAG